MHSTPRLPASPASAFRPAPASAPLRARLEGVNFSTAVPVRDVALNQRGDAVKSGVGLCP